MTASLLLALVVKPALVVGVAVVLAGLLRNRTAAARHAVWAGAVIGILALPLLEPVLPGMSLPISVTHGEPGSVMPVGSAPARLLPSEVGPAEVLLPAEQETIDAPLLIVMAIWISGMVMLAVRRVRAGMTLRHLTDAPVRSSRLEALGAEVAAGLRVRRAVRLVLSPRIVAPGTSGILRPVILLPQTAEEWSREDARAVLTHELAHAARSDCLTNLLGDLAGMVYWCNPLVGLAVRRMRLESERACDDVTVQYGTDPDRLADLLLGLARSGRIMGGFPSAITALARPRELETRLLALLDTTTPRGGIQGRVAAALAGFTFLAALPVAALTLGSRSSVVQQQSDPEPDTVSDSVTSPLSERLRPAIASIPLTTALAGPDSLLARRLWEAARMPPRHAIDLVPERAAWALTQERDGRLIDPLMESLGSRNWRITAYAAWALGIARDPRAVPALVSHMDHPVWRVRAMTAFALQEIADTRAREVMDRALSDPAWQVRSQAVRYIATSGDPEVVEKLKPLLTDRHIAVRLAAEQALALH